MATNRNGATGWVGWVFFAGFMMLVMGTLQIISGLTALLNDKYFLVTQERLIAFDFTTWGWVQLVVGIIVLMAASSVLNGGLFGRTVGVLLATLSILANFAFLSAYPIWSILVILIDVAIIYSLTVHGAEARP